MEVSTATASGTCKLVSGDTTSAEKQLLLTDLDGTMAHFVTAYLAPAISHGSSCIAKGFGLSVPEIVRILAKTTKNYDHEYPWLLEMSELRTLFKGSDQQFASDVVAPFWNGWDEAVYDCYRACPGVKQTLRALRDRNIDRVCVTNAHDFCAALRLSASGLAPFFSTLIGIETPAPLGIDSTFMTERRRRLLASCPDTKIISLSPGHKKPSPEGILRALQEHGVKPENAVMTGDSLAMDGGAAQRAGVKFALMKHEVLTTAHFDSTFIDGCGEASASAATPSAVPVALTAGQYGELLSLFPEQQKHQAA
jgi:FMN phosphatase YigB (HAD superfamily)